MHSVVVNDPRIDVTSELSQVITRGGQRLTQYTQSCDSTSTSQSNWSFQPPSTKIIVSRKFLLRLRVKFTAVGGEFQRGVATSLRQCPINSVIDVMNVSLNGGNISDNTSRRIHAMLRYNNDGKSRDNALSPMMPDQYQTYEDWTDPVYGGSSRNPMAAYGETLSQQNRGSFVPISETATELVYEITEPIFMSPFLNGLESHDDQGFVNINQIDINIKWTADLSRMLSHYNVAPNALTGVNVEFVNAPQVLVDYITPNNNQPLPLLQVLEYFKDNDYIKKEGTYAAGESFQVQTNTIKLNQIPNHITLFVKRSRQTESLFTSDTFARIDSLNVLFNNESSLFATYSKQGLFNIARGNGCNIEYAQYDKHVGCVLRIKMGKDLGLLEGLSPGVMGQFTVSVQLGCTNVASEPIEFESFLVTTLIGSIEISENALALNLGNLTVQHVMEAERSAPVVHHTDPQLGEGQGGSFFSSFRSFLKKVKSGVNTAAGLAQQVAPMLGSINPALGAAVGGIAGAAKKATGGRLSGGGMGGYGNVRKRLTRRR